MSAPRVLPPMLLAALVAGCAVPGATGPAPVPMEAFADVACGFEVDVPAGWDRAGGSDAGVFLFRAPRSAGTNESLFVLVGPAAAFSTVLAAPNGASLLWSGTPLQGASTLETSNATLAGQPSVRLKVESPRAAGEVHLLAHGNRTLAVGWSADAGRAPSDALARAGASLRLVDAPRDGCGPRPRSEAPAGPAGWTTYLHPREAWAWRHPADWTATDLSGGEGVAILFAAPQEDPEAYVDSAMVILRPVPRGPTLAELADEAVAQHRERDPTFELVSKERASLDGKEALVLRSRETNRETPVEGMRLLALHGGDLAWVEALAEPEGAPAFLADVEAALASFRFG